MKGNKGTKEEQCSRKSHYLIESSSAKTPTLIAFFLKKIVVRATLMFDVLGWSLYVIRDLREIS